MSPGLRAVTHGLEIPILGYNVSNFHVSSNATNVRSRLGYEDLHVLHPMIWPAVEDVRQDWG